MSFFRAQAIENKKQRLHGDVLLLPRLSHTLIVGCIFIWVVLVFLWLCKGHYARKETVIGWLEPPAGVVRVYAETMGTIQKIYVAEGNYVEQDQPLMLIQQQAVLNSGQQLSAELLHEYEVQKLLIEKQISSTQKIYEGRARDISKKILAEQQEQVMLEEQLTTLSQRYQLVSAQAQRYNALKQSGHVSSAEYDTVIGQELALKSDQQNLLRNSITQKNTIEQLQTEQASLPNEFANTLSQLQAKLSDISQQMTQISGQSTRIIKAARAGIVNNLQAREGQQIAANANNLLLTLIPKDAQLCAHLLIPVRSAGFVEIGQQLNIRYDAFPFQKFGLYSGEIEQISKTVLLPNELLNTPLLIKEPVYRMTAKIMQPNVQAYGQDFPLKPGMTLSADIRLSDRTLIQWLLEPLYSLKGRL